MFRTVWILSHAVKEGVATGLNREFSEACQVFTKTHLQRRFRVSNVVRM